MAQDVWVAVTEENKLKDGSALIVSAKGLPVLLIKRKDKIFAISNRCPHMGCALAGGRIDGDLITCPCHEWTFDIGTGEFLTTPEIVLPIYESRSENGKIMVRIEE